MGGIGRERIGGMSDALMMTKERNATSLNDDKVKLELEEKKNAYLPGRILVNPPR